ncbi:hypothetical protein [Micromonospora humidisoli]|uniref:Uncharacterized protein n=1 Tax=Micromonospora humidisoli TaxID=2807622 RepID=A0ABS2JAS2_9ACTN|nr:hypothetical protein [Micromonospora humidisoli]MBM7083593.1 hypothetical protein [Micromonospora humidisoli]
MSGKTNSTTYTWTPGKRFCDAEVHRTEATCAACENLGSCADCGQHVSGPAHRSCDQNGEVIHAACSPTRAARDWVDYY